jgi:hypothetical protein
MENAKPRRWKDLYFCHNGEVDHASTQITVLRSRQDGQTSEGFEANMHSWNLTSCSNCTAQPRSMLWQTIP